MGQDLGSIALDCTSSDHTSQNPKNSDRL